MDTTRETDETTCQGEDRRSRKTIRLSETQAVRRALALKRARYGMDAGVKVVKRKK